MFQSSTQWIQAFLMNSNPYFLKRAVRNCDVREDRSQSVAPANGREARVDTMSKGIRTAMQDLTKAQFPSSLNLLGCWNEFSAGWKKVRRGFSEPSIHDFRVSIRRLISQLEFAFEVTHAREAHTSIRKFRKTLRRFGGLRDVQIHLLRAESENTKWAREFSQFLKRCEKDEIQVLREWMREKKKKALQQCAWNTHQKFQDERRGISRSVFRAAMEGVLRKRFDAVTASCASFRSSRNAQDFHRMRIKFKRFRYAAEIAKPALGVFTKKQMGRMRKLQSLMGEIHDLQTYMAAMVKWSGTRVPVRLQQEYDALMKAFNERPGKFEEFTFHVHTKARSVKGASSESLSRRERVPRSGG
jgi:CHAD domain-containing protein